MQVAIFLIRKRREREINNYNKHVTKGIYKRTLPYYSYEYAEFIF